jgi:hypothetical protein
MKSKLILAALGVTGALFAASANAYGGDDVQWSVTIGNQVGTPVYGAPAYGAPVYTAPVPVYSAPAPVYAVPRSYGYGHGHGQYRQPTRWDRDGDGIPNRYDRVYNPRWDRNGDGVADRYERRYWHR